MAETKGSRLRMCEWVDDRFAEPWFLAFDANIGFHPTMVPADLEKAGPDIAAAAKAYG